MCASKLKPQRIMNHIPIKPHHEVADIGAGERTSFPATIVIGGCSC